MTIRPGFIVLAIGVLLMGLFGWWFLNNFDRVPVDLPLGFDTEARRNPLLAADKLFSENGLDTRSLATLDELPDIATTLFVPVSRREWPAERTEALRQWVESGGHAIVVAVAADEEGSNDPLLEGFGISGWTHDVDDEDDDNGKDPGRTTKVTVSWSREPLDVLFESDRFLETELSALATGADGIHAVSTAHRRGRMTVLSDYRFAVNRRIGDHDHGAFLWHLVTLEPHQRVWLVYRNEALGLWERLSTAFWMVLVSAAVMLLVYVWQCSRRFGPLLPEAVVPRRRLLEHIEASGRFLWKYDQANGLVDDVRQALLRSLEFRHPGWSSAPDLHGRLAELSGVTPEHIAHALTSAQIRDEDDFVRTIQALEAIRTHL